MNSDDKFSKYWGLYDSMMQAYDMYRLCPCNRCANKYLLYQKYVWEEIGKLDLEIEYTDSLLCEFEAEI